MRVEVIVALLVVISLSSAKKKKCSEGDGSCEAKGASLNANSLFLSHCVHLSLPLYPTNQKPFILLIPFQ